MKKINWSLEKRQTKDLILSEYNPRKISPEQREQIEKSIENFGKVVPIVINIGLRNNIVIGGNQRLKIYKSKKIVEIDVMVPDRELSLEEEKELNLRLNKNQGSWDIDLLRDVDLDLLLDVGFEDDELQGFFDDIELADDGFNVEKAIQEIQKPIVKNNEIWQLGNNYLLVGDSTNKDLVKKLMKNQKANVIYADPPYNIGLDYGKGIGGNSKYGGKYSSKDDSKTDNSYGEFLEQSIETAKNIASEDAHYFYWCDAGYIGLLQKLYSKHNIAFKRVATWVKNNQNPTPKIAFNKVCEHCVYGITGKPYLNNNFKNANEILNQEVNSGNRLHDELLEMIDLWIVKRENTKEYEHPTQKPIGVNEKPLKRCSAPGHIVFSPFAGSGSDLIACEQLERKWYGVEKDLIFATVIINRWEKFTGLKAKRVWKK